MQLNHTKKIVLCAVLTALTTLATMIIQIPSPTSGYVNLGDVFVLFSAFCLGPFYGAVAAGVGSALADLLSGYVIYAPGTLVIKAAMAICAYLVFAALKKIFKYNYPAMLCGALVAEIIMVGGYFLYSCFIMGEGLSASASIVGNVAQGVVGLAVGPLLVQAMLSAVKGFFKNKTKRADENLKDNTGKNKNTDDN